ncbi:alcohol dehydrogenase [Claviceps digitariae]|nr:alcohol dehydrogenase [Claviceps digitariae]
MTAPEIPTEQYAAVVEKTGGPVVYKKIPVPKPAPDEVLIHVLYSGVCHTDLHAMLGDWPLPTKLPLVGGHEGAGVVVACGSLVGGGGGDNDDSGNGSSSSSSSDLRIGDKVGIKWLNGSCLRCAYCTNMDESLCQDALLSGYTVDGSFQQYAVAKAAHVARIPPECDLEAVAPILCAGLTVYKGLKESGARPGQSVAIVGAGGGLGCFAIQYAKAMGLHVVAIDGGDDRKRDICMELGAAAYVDFATTPGGDEGLVQQVKKAAGPDGLGPHAVLLVAAHEKPFRQATQYVRARGTVVCIGLPANATFSAPVFDTVVRMITIKGSYVGNRADTAEALEFYRRGLIKVPFKTVGLSQLQEVYKLMEEGKIAGRYIVDTSK